MIVQEAYRLFKNEPKLKELVVLSCYEYDDRFVFNAIPEEYASAKDSFKILGCSYAVMKNGSGIGRFRATDIPIDEYKRGKRITTYDKQ